MINIYYVERAGSEKASLLYSIKKRITVFQVPVYISGHKIRYIE